jgi:hypothetical protein
LSTCSCVLLHATSRHGSTMLLSANLRRSVRVPTLHSRIGYRLMKRYYLPCTCAAVVLSSPVPLHFFTTASFYLHRTIAHVVLSFFSHQSSHRSSFSALLSNTSFNRYLYLAFFNGLWVVFPLWILWEAYRAISVAMSQAEMVDLVNYLKKAD